ncbi:MAG TPA: hypothetical protein VNS88_02545 [Nitrospiraceae bacterium]|nr:hypothetical protein [Nitrospiraceae bacterium]
MASEELARQDDYGLHERQLKALGRLSRLGAKPREENEPYDSDPQIRALQLVYEGRMGGPGLKQGRPRTGVSTTAERQQRAAETIATEIRSRFTGKMIKALDRALRKDAGTKANLDAVKLALDIENREASLQLKENEADFDTKTKEELLATLFELVAQPQTAAAIEGSAYEVITDAEEVTEDTPAAGATGSNGNSASTRVNGRDTGSTGSTDGQRLAAHRAESANPFTQVALRRANKR